MSTTLEHLRSPETESRQADSAAARSISLARVIRSEWIKLRSLRSTWAMLLSIVAVMIGFAALAAAVSTGSVAAPGGDDGPSFGGSDPLSTVLTGAEFGVLLIGVLGCLAGAREYGSRMITATVAAVPRRWQVVVAKAVTLTAVMLPTALVASFAAFGVGMSILSASGEETVSLADGDVLTSVIGMAAYMTAIALLGLTVGIMLRSVAASIAVLVAGIMVIPGLAGALLPDSWDEVLKYLPEQAASSFTSLDSSGTLSGTAGALALTGWVAAALIGAIVAITRRDV